MPKPLLPERPMAPAVFQILIALADQPLHGYGIMLDIAERSEGKVKLSPGTLYGSIRRMLDEGLIAELRDRQNSNSACRKWEFCLSSDQI